MATCKEHMERLQKPMGLTQGVESCTPSLEFLENGHFSTIDILD